jgi:hypothetical protein
MKVRWNLTGKLKGVKKSDVLILSIAKSGRTWLRVMINKYLSLAYNVPFGLDDLSMHNSEIPKILYTHEGWANYDSATFKQRFLGRYIVPDNVLSTKKVILLYRDPRDVVVSLYFQLVKRSRKKDVRSRKNMTQLDLVVGDSNRMARIVKVMNDWRKRLENHSDCLWVSYEDLMVDPHREFVEILRHIGFDTINEDLAAEAIEFSKFENMKKMEAEDQFNTNILRPGDPSDPDSYKVRKGEVGGYMNYFSEDELPFLDKSIEDLDPFYGYNKTSD